MTQRNTRNEAYAWMNNGSMPLTRGDVFAEAAALVALLFSLGVGIVIAMLPVSAQAATVQAAAAAATAAKPSLELAAYKVVPAAPNAPEHLVPATQARAGDHLEYVATYHNPTAAALHQVQVTLPVPANGVEVMLETIAPRADLASTDGKQYAAFPLQRTETLADGRKITRSAPAADYRFLRWNLGDIPAGAERTVRTRVQLTGDAPAAH